MHQHERRLKRIEAGDYGYGWMTYEYVLKAVALDFWSLLKMEWVDSDRFFD